MMQDTNASTGSALSTAATQQSEAPGDAERASMTCRLLNGVLYRFYKALEPYHFDSHDEAIAKIADLVRAEVAGRTTQAVTAAPVQAAATINSEEFRKLIFAYTEALFGANEREQAATFKDLVSHIDAKISAPTQAYLSEQAVRDQALSDAATIVKRYVGCEPIAETILALRSPSTSQTSDEKGGAA